MSEPSTVVAPDCASSASIVRRTGSSKSKRGPRGGIYDPFPLKFHRMLDQIRAEGQESVVSWLSHGRAFKIHKPKVFAATIMPRFFNQSKYTSFQRQLNLYGFSRCCRGPDAGAYHHLFFLRGKQPLVKNIVRTKIKGNGHKTMKVHDAEPDFHTMPPLPDDRLELEPSDGSSINSDPCLDVQPTMAVSSAGFGLHSSLSSPDPSPSIQDFATTNNVYPSPSSPAEVSRQVSLSEDASSADLVHGLNESIFIHELAMGCTILCQMKTQRVTNL